MTYLVLNRRRILDRLLGWFPAAAEELVVLTAPGPAKAVDVQEYVRRVRHLEVADDYESARVDQRIEELCREHRVEAILHTAEIDIIRAARIGGWLGLHGQSMESATAYRDKYVMKDHAARGGMQVAPMRRIDDVASLRAFAEEHGFPVVVKRVDGAASAGMGVAADEAELEELTAPWSNGVPRRPMLAESWIEGDLYHVDGLMRESTVLFSWPSRYLHTQWRSKSQSLSQLTGMLHPTDPMAPRLQAAARRVVAALPPSSVALPFHAEFFHTPVDHVALCEIACRAGGILIVDAFEHAFGLNLYEAGLKGQALRFDEIRWRDLPDRHGNGWFMPLRGRLLEIPDHCPLPTACSYRRIGTAGASYDDPTSIGDVIAEVVFRIDGTDTCADLRAVDDWWHDSARWETHGALA